jgi:catechol 2,3-dioxygenase-like lactoylglutathione lyase family enzyme
MIDHLSIPVSDIVRASAFYDRALAPLGAKRQMEFTGEDYAGIGYGPTAGKPVFWIGAAVPPSPVSAPPSGQHIAFAAPDRATVDAFYREAMAAGATDNGAPGLRPRYHPNYYGAFVIDADGHRLEAVCHRPE